VSCKYRARKSGASGFARPGAGLVALFAALALVACDGDSFKPNTAAGDKVPSSSNRMIASGETWRDVCSMDTADKLHRWKIADLLSEHKPFLVVFGTPQHCTMCVDQLVRVATLQEKYGDRFAVLHVDGYKDDPTWVAWGIKGEPWTFIVDNEGVVRKVFPGPTDVFLMEQAIDQVLEDRT